jgi:hypothetical protein
MLQCLSTVCVKHINSYFVQHNMFHHRYQSGVELLHCAVHTTAHLTSIHLHMYPRYAPVGSWAHC